MATAIIQGTQEAEHDSSSTRSTLDAEPEFKTADLLVEEHHSIATLICRHGVRVGRIYPRCS